MPVKLLPWTILAATLAGGLGYWLGESRGHQRGALETQAAHDAGRVESLNNAIGALRDEITGSAQANSQIRLAVAALEQQNRTSSKELKYALENRPVVCRFDADSMRIITAAADRADALAAGGTGAALPASDTPGGRQ